MSSVAHLPASCFCFFHVNKLDVINSRHSLFTPPGAWRRLWRCAHNKKRCTSAREVWDARGEGASREIYDLS